MSSTSTDSKFSVNCTWLGHAAVCLDDGESTVLIDPWIQNPKANDASKSVFKKVTAILLTHGHSDHVGESIELAKKYNCKIYCIYELALSLQKSNVDATPEMFVGMNKGGWIDLPDTGWSVIQTEASHSSGCIANDGSVLHAGAATGWVLSRKDGPMFYHAGDTGLFGDMRWIINDCYMDTIQTKIAFLPIGARFTLGPKEAGYAVSKLLLNIDHVVPIHWGTFPLLTGRPEEMKKHVTRSNVSIDELKVGEPRKYT